MIIKELKLKDFRNYELLNICFKENINLFTGSNGQGKTNIIESIFLCGFGKSFRTNKDSDMIRFGAENCFVKVICEKDGEDIPIEVGISSSSKRINIGGKPIKKMSELLENMSLVIFSPEDLKIVKEDPDKRRKFMDREICKISINYLNALNSYKKVLNQRNIYLKSLEVEDELLDLWDIQLADYSEKIMKNRKKFIAEISFIADEIHKSISKREENLKLIYTPSLKIKDDEDFKEEFLKIFSSSRDQDKKNRTTTLGPHKDDFKFMLEELDMRKFGSQGQQRTCALSIKLAELALLEREINDKPILLLDDVMSELDENRQKYLLEFLRENQVFITTTEFNYENLIEKNCKKMVVTKGTVS